MKRWTALIDDMVAGRWINPETGKPGTVPYKSVVIAETLEGRESELVTSLGIKGRIAVVCDENTRDVMGLRVAKALQAAHNSGISGVETVVLDHPHADEANLDGLREKTRHVDALVAVGSGTINDLCKYVTATDGRRYCVFGTAPSMNGYTSTTASITLANGLKVSKPAHAPLGVFIDLKVNAAVPTYLVASGFGDCLVRSVAQFDWWLSHRMLDTFYTELPFQLEAADERELMARASDLAKGDIEAVGYLQRVLTPLRLRRQLHRHEQSWLDGRASDFALHRLLRRRPSSRHFAWTTGRRRKPDHGAVAKTPSRCRHASDGFRHEDRRRRYAPPLRH